jgi:hypothetical protein
LFNESQGIGQEDLQQVQSDSAQGRSASAVHEHPAQTEARLDDFRFWIWDFGLNRKSEI